MRSRGGGSELIEVIVKVQKVGGDHQGLAVGRGGGVARLGVVGDVVYRDVNQE